METCYKDFLSNITNSDKIGLLLWKVYNLWQRELKKALVELDITHSQFLLLGATLWGNHCQAEVTQKSLSDKTGIDPMTTSTVLRTLQKKGWIKRKFSKKDTRTRLISLTENGKKIVESATKELKKFNDSFFGPLKEQRGQFQENLFILLMTDEHIKEEFKKYYYDDKFKESILITEKS
ncbi:MAG: MarR family transcriptional regulator [Flavobacteriaceae bacterium]|jgi:DNA-binding MarR family transcriptional regulator|nr:MarR family transcriptional regulator [Flavobacteriaceae bacterium]